MPREAAYRECLRVMREAMGADAFFLTCGTPILPAIGLCDAIRIGPDVLIYGKNIATPTCFTIPPSQGQRMPSAQSSIVCGSSHCCTSTPTWRILSQGANQLTQEQRLLLQNLANVCEFKATSDLPQWLGRVEFDQLRSFLNATPKIEQTGRYTFHIDDSIVDFTSATSLPDIPKGLTALWGRLVGWLGDRYFLLRMYKVLNLGRFRKRKSNIL